jgi:hypothetical protein
MLRLPAPARGFANKRFKTLAWAAREWAPHRRNANGGQN